MVDDERAWRASLEARIANLSRDQSTAVDRLRRQVVFHRVLARTSREESWVLKGGFALDVRLDVARATVDLDLALRTEGEVAAVVHDRLDDLLAVDVDADGFTFVVGAPRPLQSDAAGNPAWRFALTARLAGKTFQSIRLDVVARPEEISGGVEQIEIPSPVPGTRLTSVRTPAVDVAQHAAEKVHAYGRLYAQDRPSTRVKDLVDLVLLIEAGLLDTAQWNVRFHHVYWVRDSGPPPSDLPPPPDSWRRPYESYAADLGVSARTLDQAYTLVTDLYRTALSIKENP